MIDFRFRLTRHDKAYLCFLLPGLLSLVSRIASLIPMDTGISGGIGFLVLIPLALASIVTTVYGIYLTIVLHDDKFLALLAVLSLLYLTQLFTETGSAAFQNVVGLAYGLVVVGIVWYWFFRRRPKGSEKSGMKPAN